AGAHVASTRETRDDRDRILVVHRWDTTASRVYSIVRQRVIDALAARARRAGAGLAPGWAAPDAPASGELRLADGSRIAADLIVGADGVNSRIRDSLGLLAKRRRLADGAIRLLIDKTAEERSAGGDGRTIEYWSGSRRIVFTPCSDQDIYIALTMLNADDIATRVPVDRAEWTRSFPHLADLIARFGTQGHYAPFEWIRLRRWSAGRVAVLGDAAHALPPNIGQGAGCAMMNALSLAVHLDGAADIPAALAAWEARERPITEHTQRVSVWLRVPTTWPPVRRNLTFRRMGKSKWLVRQRIRTALHRPTGTPGALSS